MLLLVFKSSVTSILTIFLFWRLGIYFLPFFTVTSRWLNIDVDARSSQVELFVLFVHHKWNCSICYVKGTVFIYHFVKFTHQRYYYLTSQNPCIFSYWKWYGTLWKYIKNLYIVDSLIATFIVLIVKIACWILRMLNVYNMCFIMPYGLPVHILFQTWFMIL